MFPRKHSSKQSISYLLLVFAIGTIIIVSVAGYYIAAVLPGSLPTQISTTFSTATTSTQYSYLPYHNNTLSNTIVIIMNGASLGKQESYNPQYVTVEIGVNNTVVWRNFDTVNQTIVESNNLFNQTILPQQSWNYTFTAPGTYYYFSPTYPWENGTVTVVS